jgi:hypothetical protein
LVADLLDWDSLYAAGRLHKPVRILEKSDESKDPVSLHINEAKCGMCVEFT